MKLKILAASIALLSAQVYAQSNTTTYWETGINGAEYFKSKTLQPINADSAWARGFTGKGSTIAIVDTGIDTKNTEFANRIISTKDFTNSTNGITDTLGHGTHVAGIAAAAHNGVGVEGVAFDANLIVAKVYNNSGVATIPTILSGISWASSNNATVINLSSSMAVPTLIKPVPLSPNSYYTSATNTGTLPGGLNAQQWASALTGQSILVMAAGNNGAKTPGAQGALATATDSKGNLILGGRMIIVGNWNEQTNKIDASSNQAGSLCAVVVANHCQDKYSISQFYIMAPGVNIYSTVPTTVNNTGIASMTGTSMATPAVSGAVAILHQQWPQLSGAAITQLLLTTANKNLPGYDVNIMGQGLLDLNKATLPTGGLALMTAGNIVNNSSTQPLSPIVVTTSGSANTANISKLMVVDGIGRDYYIPGKSFTATASTGYDFNVKQAAMPYITRNNYSQNNNYTDHVSSRVGNVEMSLYIDNTTGNPNLAPVMSEFNYYNDLQSNTTVKFTVGNFTESNSWLGNSLSGYGTASGANSSHTTFAGIGLDHKIDNSTQVYATVMAGITNTGVSNSLINSVGPIMSWAWNLGLERKLNDSNSIGIMAYQPPTVYNAQATGNVPVGLDSNYNVVNAGSVDLSSNTPEYRVGLYYKLTEKSGKNIMAFVENRQNVQGQEGVSSNVAGLLASVRF
jgi:subtilisin family serine protease